MAPVGNAVTLALSPATARDVAVVPRVRPVIQRFERARVDDVPGAVAAAFARSEIPARLRPGQRIAVAVGSRGIASIAAVVRAVVRALRDAGAEPFVTPAMGSHGGGTVDGQVALLHSLGMTEDQIGAPIRATMDVVETARLPDGLPLHTSALAARADGIVLVNRIKPHTAFRGPVESGLTKLLVAGLGNTTGITALHARGIETFHHLLPAAAAALVERLPVLCGIALIENGYNELAHVELVPAAALGAREPELLVRARALMPRLLFDDLDVLVLEQIGKDISGPGFDPNVVGRNARTCPVFDGPRIGRIVALSLSPGSLGNAGGMGPLDLITARLLGQIDFETSYWNAIASTHVELAALPMVARTGADAVALAIQAIHGRSPDQVRLVYARSTKHLTRVFVSPALEPYVRDHPRLELAGEPRPLLEADEPFAFPAP